MQPEKIIKKIYISESSKKDALTSEVLQQYSSEICEVISDDKFPNTKDIDPKQVLWLTHSKGDVVKGCPGTDKSYICCKYQVINHTLNCPLNCSYCILQFYLNQPATIIYTNVDEILRELEKKLGQQPKRLIRIGTGELGDSLALKGSRLFAKKVAKLFQKFPNAMFEIKSKLTATEDLFELPNIGNIVFSWSVNPQAIIDKEESMADSLEQRLQAAKLAQKKGFLTGFHFDPILAYDNWQALYSEAIDAIYAMVNPDKIPWISMGSLRFPPSMKDEIIATYPHTNIPYGEMIKAVDGKLRYARPVRVPIYRHVYNKLTEISNPPFIYFCMESQLVWEEVMGFSPNSNDHLDMMFAKSIYKRFNFTSINPQRHYYQDALNLDGTEF